MFILIVFLQAIMLDSTMIGPTPDLNQVLVMLQQLQLKNNTLQELLQNMQTSCKGTIVLFFR